MAQMDLSIIIINWKSVSFTRQCLVSICLNGGELNYEVIVVDNASFDGCEQMVKSEFPQFTFIQAHQNLGFSGANNLAFAQCRGRYVLFLNPDTEIQGDALQKLMSVLESAPHVGMVGARLLNSDHSLQTTCVVALPSILNQSLSSNYLRHTFPKWGIWGMRPLFEKSSDPRPVEAISGACMMCRKEVVQRVGGFSADYFMYSEDMDLCLKIAQSGRKIYYVPTAEIVHHAAGSSSSHEETNFSTIMVRESVVRFMEQHRGRAYAVLFRCSTAFMAAGRLSLFMTILPVAVYPPGYRFLRRTLSKWFAVLVWSFGFTRWVRQYRPSPLPLSREPHSSKLEEVHVPSCAE
jgi:N-acetylglucosaminyl-diphospho-decaprenol L-rhamnosyltransferase